MDASLQAIIDGYNSTLPLAEAWTIPAIWYLDSRLLDLERRTVFARSWQFVARLEQVRNPGQYITCDLAGEPLVIVRGKDGILRGFFNVCRHHAAAVATEPAGEAGQLRCPYHGWTYSLEGELKATPDFAGVCNFDRGSMGLVAVETAAWGNWVFVKLVAGAPSLETFLGEDLISRTQPLELEDFQWFERRYYTIECNWKVFVDNYLDGGYHVPHVHKGLASVLDNSMYTIENGQRFCLQWSPVVKEGGEQQTRDVRGGDRALYFWIYPNLMINYYEGVLDTNLVVPRGVDRTEVIFDFYFTDHSEAARPRNLASIAVSTGIQDEDTAICESVQRGLNSRAYTAGRLSVRREAGVHLFHRLLHADFEKRE